jgi:hypothetical protein
LEPNISEFSYGYTLTRELDNLFGPQITAAPVFPSLIAEGDLGYDLRLERNGIPLFIQFKLCHCMVRDTAAEIKQHGLFPAGSNFYRMYIRAARHSRQHQLLLDLEGRGFDVFYAAPAFHQPVELDQAYLTSNVAARSVFVSPSAIGQLPDDDHLHVAFVPNGAAYLLSAPAKIQKSVDREGMARSVRVRLKTSQTPLKEVMERVAHELMDIARLSATQPKGTEEERVSQILGLRGLKSAPELAAYLSITFFGCELFAVSEVPA